MASQGPESSLSGEQGHNTMKTKLMRASAHGDAKSIKDMWRSNDVWDVLKNVRDEDQMTPLHRAVIADHKEVVDVLLSRDPGGPGLFYFNFLHARTLQGWTAIHFAIFSENEEILKTLISKYDACTKPPVPEWDFADVYWMTPLHYAVLGNKVAQMKQLLEWRSYGPHLNARDYFQRTPLHLASCHRPVSVEDLLKHPMVDMNAKDSFMQTPFHWAVCFGRVDVVRLLVLILLDTSGRPVQVNHRDFEGRSVLEIAIEDTLLDLIPTVLGVLPSVPEEHDKWALKDSRKMAHHREVNAEIEKLLRLCPDVKEEAKSLQTSLAINVTVLTSYLLVAGWIASATFNKILTLSDHLALNYFTIVIHVLLFCSSGGTLVSCATTLRFLGTTVHIGQRSLVVRRAISLIGRMLLHVAFWCVGAFICDNAGYILDSAETFQYPSNTLFGLLLVLGLSVGAGLLLHLGVALSIESLSQHERFFLTGRLSDTGSKDTGSKLFRYFFYFVDELFCGLPVNTKNKLFGKRGKSFSTTRAQQEFWKSDDRNQLLEKVQNAMKESMSSHPGAQQSSTSHFANDYWRQKNVPSKILKQFQDIEHEVSRLETVYAKLSGDLRLHELQDVQSARQNMFHLDRLPQGLFYWAKGLRWLQSSTMWEPIMLPYQILINMEFLDPCKPLSVFFRGYVFGRDFKIFKNLSDGITAKKHKMGSEVAHPTETH